MNAKVHAAARTEAARVNRCPLDGLVDETTAKLWEVFASVEPPGSASLKGAAHQQKPRTYGLIGKLVTPMLRKTFDERPSLGPLGLRIHTEDDTIRTATLKDATTWKGLQKCWSDTLAHNMAWVLEEATRSQSTHMVALKSLWAIRIRALPAQRSLDEQLSSGSDTGSLQCMREAYGMNRYLTGLGMPREQKLAVLRRSTSPIIEDAGIGIGPIYSIQPNVHGRAAKQRRAFFIYHT